MKLFDLHGKVAFVCGGGRGIGKAIALGLAQAGADVAVAARTPEQVEATAAELAALGVRSLGVRLDVARVADIAGAVQQVTSTLGPVDILYNVAGINIRGPMQDLTEAQFDQLMDINYKGIFFLTQAVGRQMIARGQGGKIVNIASIVTGMGLTKIVVYTGSKGALGQLTKGLAVEWAPHNIQVNALAPGFIATDLNAHLWSDEFRNWILQRTPAGRVGRPEDMVGTAVFLASAAADFVTGQVIYVDGGVSAGSWWPL